MRIWGHISTLQGPLIAAAGGASGIMSAMTAGSIADAKAHGQPTGPAGASDPLLDLIKKHLAGPPAPPTPPAPIQPANPGYGGASGGTA